MQERGESTKVYIESLGNRILKIESEKIVNTIEIEARSEDELLEKLYKKYEKIDDEILE